jgi:diguanylate cyclase (GGDEF)-like protein
VAIEDGRLVEFAPYRLTHLSGVEIESVASISRAVERGLAPQARARTALPASGALIVAIDELIGQAEPRGPREGALVYADLDRFKLLNDTLGHPAGDAALIHFARIIHGQIRAGDIPARIGGEEFAIWLPKADLETGTRIAERIRIKLGTTPWDWQGRSWPLSASFGVAACPETGRRVASLPAQADAALYVAKNSGRNRVERAGK